MLMVHVSSTPTLRFGSILKSRSSYGLLAPGAPVLLPGISDPVMLTRPGSGMLLPSTPMRKAVLGSVFPKVPQPPNAPPVCATFFHGTHLPNPIPRPDHITH